MPASPESVSGMHVRIPETHIILAKIAARASGQTLTGYIDNLIVADGSRVLADPEETAHIIEDIDSQIDQLNRTRQAIADLGNIASSQ
jgi:hypothetical protein